MKRAITAAMILGAAGLLPGCLFDFDDSFGYEPGAYQRNELSVAAPSMSGNLGTVQANQGDVYVQNSRGGASYSYIELRSNDASGATMTGITIDGGLSSLEPGQQYEVGSSVLGCSGPEQDYWTYDSSADRVLVWAEQLDGPSYRLHFHAEWDGYGDEPGSTVDGSFDYERYVD